jgi:hypothetical protein
VRAPGDLSLLCCFALVANGCARIDTSRRHCDATRSSVAGKSTAVPHLPRPSPSGDGSVLAALLSKGSITLDSWLPVLGADEYEQIGHGDRLLHDAGIPSEMFASKGAYSVVLARDFERARLLVASDERSRPFVVTDEQLLAWVDRRSSLGLR